MTLDQIDAALLGWRTRLHTAGENLLALSQTDAYRRLRGEGGWPKAVLTGTTAARVTPAMEALGELWSHFGRLTDAIDRAENLRKDVSRLFPSRQALDEIAGLLEGPSIRLPPLVTPLAGRGLFGPAQTEQAITPADLLAAMTRCFERARDAVVAVGTAWDLVPVALDRLATDAARLEAPAGPFAGELAQVRDEIDRMRQTADQGPLDAEAQLPDLIARVAAIRDRLAGLARDREQFQSAMADARALLERVTLATRDAETAAAERRLKVAADVGLGPPDTSLVAALGPWLDRLDMAVQNGHLAGARIGLEKWTLAATRLLNQAESARDEAHRLLDRRRDLRGLFDALRAKAAAAGRAEDAELTQLAQRADGLLRQRPSPLAEAERVVGEYQRRLL